MMTYSDFKPLEYVVREVYAKVVNSFRFIRDELSNGINLSDKLADKLLILYQITEAPEQLEELNPLFDGYSVLYDKIISEVRSKQIKDDSVASLRRHCDRIKGTIDKMPEYKKGISLYEGYFTYEAYFDASVIARTLDNQIVEAFKKLVAKEDGIF